MGVRVDPADPFYVPVNAHPPTSVLLVFPLAWLGYSDAFLAWALLSLFAFALSCWMVGRELGIRLSLWCVIPSTALLLVCYPFRLHLEQGQLAIVLLGLIVGAWVADRHGRPVLAGALLATATAVKLFPGFLFVFFLARKRWRALAGGAATLIVLAVVTTAVLGGDIFAVYVREILAGVGDFRSGWGNVSLPGVWFKLFDPVTDRMRVEPLWRDPALARAGSLACGVIVTALVTWFALRAKSRSEEDHAFGLTIVAMVLVSPLTWEHYLPLLLFPLALAWVDLPIAGVTRKHLTFVVLLALLWADSNQLTEPFLPGSYLRNVANPVHTITLLSLKTYTLLGLFVFGALARRTTTLEERLGGPEVRTDTPSPQRLSHLAPALPCSSPVS
jgi:hypothetical protein